MSDIQVKPLFPLDAGFLRRECPLCKREFKILLEQNEIEDITQKGISSYLLEEENCALQKGEENFSTNEYVCPYCGQTSDINSWWTKEQVAYIHIFLKNLINQQLTSFKNQFNKKSSGLIKLELKVQSNEQIDPWIPPEINDMELFDLPCCQRKIKIEEDWTDTIYCFFCGFPHKR